MTTLITVSNSEGVIGRCDAHCHNAKHEKCNCVCGGMNHGVGKAQAEKNTARHAKDMIERYRILGNPENQFTFAQAGLFEE